MVGVGGGGGGAWSDVFIFIVVFGSVEGGVFSGGVSHYSVRGWYDNVGGICLWVVVCGGDGGGAAGVGVGECGGVGGNMSKVGVGGVRWGVVIVFAVGNSIRFRSCRVVGAGGRAERRVVWAWSGDGWVK